MSKKLHCLDIDTKLLNTLLKNKLCTCKDVLLRSHFELVNILSTSYSEATELLKKASDTLSIQPITALDLLQQRSNIQISSGLYVLDEILSGGLPIATLIEIAGPPGCGKTQLCLTIAASVLTNLPEKTIIYIDTEGSFDPVRLLEVARCKYPTVYTNEGTDLSQNLLESLDDEFNTDELCHLGNRVLYLRESTCDQLLKRLDELEALILESNTTLIILDSIGSIIRREFDCSSINSTHQRNKVLSKIVSHLKLLAESYNIPVIAINQITTCFNQQKRKYSDEDNNDSLTDENEDVIIALGPMWAHAVNTRLVLQFTENNLNRQIILVKSPCSPQAKVLYTIGAAGIIIKDNVEIERCSTLLDMNNFPIHMRSGIIY